MMNPKGFVLWFTGLSGAGKSTLANLTAIALRERSVTVEILDGDEIRTHLSKGLGFSREDRDTSVRRIGYVAKVVARVGACAITAAISPYRETRDEVRAQIERFCEVYLACSIPVLTARDPKGLYEKALKGEIKNFTGVDDPYEPPTNAEITLDTSTMEPAACVESILEKLEALGYLDEREVAPTPLADPVGEIPVVAELARGDVAVDGAVRVVLSSSADRAILAWIASGVVAPINGPFTERDLVKVRKESRLERGVLFDAELALEADIAGERVTLADDAGDLARLDGGRMVGCALPETGLAARVRADLVSRDARRSAAVFVDRELHAGDVYLLRAAVESCDALVVVVLVGVEAPSLDRGGVDALRATLDRDGFGDRAVLVELPLLAGMASRGLPLTRAVVAKNLGASEIVLFEDDDGLDARRADVEKELGLHLRPRLATFTSRSARSGADIRSERTRALGAKWERIER